MSKYKEKCDNVLGDSAENNYGQSYDIFDDDVTGDQIETVPMESEDDDPAPKKKNKYSRFDDDDDDFEIDEAVTQQNPNLKSGIYDDSDDDRESHINWLVDDDEDYIKPSRIYDDILYFGNANPERKEDYTVDLESLNQFAPREEVISDPDQFVDYTIQKIFELGAQHKIVRTLIFFVVHFRLGAEQYYGMKYVLRCIRRAARLHRDTIHKYISIAKVESQLKINNGIMSVQALMELYRCEPKTRGEILEIAISYQLQDEAEYAAKPKRGKAKRFARKPKPFPGLKHVNLAVKHYEMLEKTRKELIEQGEDPRTAEVRLALPLSRVKSKNNNGAKKQKTNPLDPWREDVIDADRREIIEDFYFDSLRKKEKFLKEFGYFLKMGKISVKRTLLRELTIKRKQNTTAYHLNRILAYHDQHEINRIIKQLREDIQS